MRTDGVAATLEAVQSKLDQPLALGYCNVGRVLEVGTGVEGFANGERVVSNGKHAEAVVVPRNLCARIPEGVTFEQAAYTAVASIGLEGVRLARCKTLDLSVPSHSELVLEGTITPGEELPDGPFGDHMGFYGGIEASPLVRFHCITHRRNPIFLTTFSGRPPKEEAMLAIALNRIYTPILRQQIPEIVDFFLPMEALSYKLAVIAIDKAYPGQARRAAMAFWSALPQFTYTKFVVVVDKSINIRDPRQVVWAISAQVDPQRDLFVLENTPFDTLDFASERLGLGGRLAIDATTKIGPERRHPWGEPLGRHGELEARVQARWQELGLADLPEGDPDPALFGYTLEHVLERLASGRAG
jgi:4-hydroxy-3-polyprenylbenzoate decarboxylase